MPTLPAAVRARMPPEVTDLIYSFLDYKNPHFMDAEMRAEYLYKLFLIQTVDCMYQKDSSVLPYIKGYVIPRVLQYPESFDSFHMTAHYDDNQYLLVSISTGSGMGAITHHFITAESYWAQLHARCAARKKQKIIMMRLFLILWLATWFCGHYLFFC